MLKSFRIFPNQQAWDDKTEWYQKTLNKNGGGDDFVAFGSTVIYQRVIERPECYAEFGVYWFAVKDVLARQGYVFGDTVDEEMLAEYRGKTDAHTLVAADLFKDFYRNTYFTGTTHFTLEKDGRDWILNDPEMAARV